MNYFDQDESDLGRLETGRRERQGEEGELYRLDNPYSWLILLGLMAVLGCIVADWRSLRA